MKEEKTRKIFLNDHLGCFGEFNSEDRLCRKLCAIRLGCAIERDQNEQLEMLEEMFNPEDTHVTVQ